MNGIFTRSHTPVLLFVILIIELLPGFSALADFHYVSIDNKDFPDLLKELAASTNIRLLEQISPGKHLIWIKNKDQIRNIEHDSRLNIVSERFSPLLPDHNLDELEKLHGRYCVWTLDGTESDQFNELLDDPSVELIHKSLIHVSQSVTYRIHGVNLHGISYSRLLKTAAVRCFYPESGTPILENELSTLQVLSTSDQINSGIRRDESLQSLGVSGLRTRIGIIDSGCGNNLSTENHPDLNHLISHFLTYPGSPGFDYVGHGTHIAGIVAGTASSGSIGPMGYFKGAGVAPGCTLTISDALIALPFPPSNGFQGMIQDIAKTGTHLCNNSWNDGEGSGVGYHPNCAIWDSAVRNTDVPGYSGEWPLSIVFSAGNRGPDLQTITSPKEAKNIITVGALGNFLTGAQDEPIDLSSRGPCIDGRIAPLIAAPGEEIISTWPETDYDSRSGTSSAAAHATGVLALMKEWWDEKVTKPISPAMLKCIAVLATDIITEELPDPAVGWGRINFSQFQPLYPSSQKFDQDHIFTTPGDRWAAKLVTLNLDKPVDVVLCWTDPPASPGANPALVNNLDLVCYNNEQLYRGNNFTGVFSDYDGIADDLNNLERIRLESPERCMNLEVLATDIMGDGVPGNSILLDQDFALLVKNACLVMETPGIHPGKFKYSKSEPVEFIVTDSSEPPLNSITVEARSFFARDNLSIQCNPLFNDSGLFTGSFKLNKNEEDAGLTTENSDMIYLKFRDTPEIRERPLLVDNIKPEFLKISFKDVNANSTDFLIETTEYCYCTICYRKSCENEWSQTPTGYLQNRHEIKLQNLDSLSHYEAYILLQDLADNRQDTRSLFPSINWTTSRVDVVYSAFMNSDPQFELLDQQWEWGEPQGNGTPGDPESGVTGQNVLGYNLQGNYSNRMSSADAISSSIDCGKPGNYHLAFHRWLCSEPGILDFAGISVKNRENDWVSIWNNPYYDLADENWIYQRFNVTDFAEGNNDFQFKFTQGPTDGGFTRCGWNIDDILLEHHIFTIPTPTPIVTSSEPQITLVANPEIVSPGVLFKLNASVFTDSEIDNLALTAVILNDDGSYLFYPGWTPEPGWIDLDLPDRGLFQIPLLGFIVPTFDTSADLSLMAYIWNRDSPQEFSASKVLHLRFIPDQHSRQLY